ncbi:hypothetical protein MNB_SV-6-1709 [hydrothermal vent metagenome]|uniref:SWIM-type domain-containing protein n=1 Tax=hydrothermal vent metagenome TaxID=652676 RepID=A0A1W1B9U8_9ZZZZ
MEDFFITKRDILENFDSTSYSRGFSYYRDGKVLSFDIYPQKDGEADIYSRVKGSHIYTQGIEVVLDINDGSFIIESDCSCPVGYNCKHAAAVLFQVLNALQKKEQAMPKKSATDKWLDNFLDTNKKKGGETLLDQDKFLTYRVFEDSYADFNFYKSKILKSGSISKGAKISHDNLFYYYTYEWKYDYLTQSDRYSRCR